MRLPRRPFALRTRLLLAIVIGVGLTLALLITVFNVALDRSLTNDADEIARSRAQGELAAVTVGHGVLRAPDTAVNPELDSRAWIFNNERALRSPPADAKLTFAAHGESGAPEGFTTLGDTARLYTLPVIDPAGDRVGTIVSAVPLAPYNRTRNVALLASTALGIVVLAAVAFASHLILRAALRPVARMTAEAAAWSESDMDKRFAVGPPDDEITRLAATFDGLLDRLASGMRRERRLTAEVSHELRTPLAQIRAEADLALRRERTPREYQDALEVIRSGADRLQSTVETLMATARQEAPLPRGTGDARAAASDVVTACGPAAAARGIDLDLTGPESVRAGVETPVMERILQPIVENACRYARERVTVAVLTEGREVRIEVADDGPGVPDDEREVIFEPGVRGSARGAAGGGAGLGLPLSRRLARAAGGDVEAVTGNGGGRFSVRVPAA